MDIIQEIFESLYEMRDEKYKLFQCKLMPTVSPEKVIGVRTPALRSYAKEVYKSGNFETFLSALPHKYYEENNLHGFLIDLTNDYERCIILLNDFLPYVDNWATCDLMSPKIFKKHRAQLYEQCTIWLNSDSLYTVRFAVGMLMGHFLDEDFKCEALNLVAEIRSEEYYINMMKAWYFATALAKQYDAALPYIQNRCLDRWSHNKAIQKSIESYRITDEQKQYLKTLKY